MLRRRSVLLARQLAVVVLVELAEILVVRRAFHLLAREVAVVVLVERLEHRLGAAVGAFSLARARAAAAALRARALALVAAGLQGERRREGGGCRQDHQSLQLHG